MKRREFIGAAGALALYPLASRGQSLPPRFADMHGLTRTIMPGYAEFASLEDGLAKRGLKPAEIEGILGGNYIRVLRAAMTT